LIGVLACTIVAGSIVYFNRSGPSDAVAAEADTTAAPAPMASPAASNATPVVVKANEPAKPAAQRPTQPLTPAGITTFAASANPIAANPTTKPTVSEAARPALALNASTTRPAGAAAPAATNVPTLTQAKTKADAGQLLAARNDYNAALINGRLSPADERIAKAAIAELNKTIVFSPRKFTDDTWAGTYVVQSGDRLQKIANTHSVTWELLCRINGMTDPRKLRAGQTLKLLKGPFHGIVSKSGFTLDLYLGAPGGPGSMYVTTFPVGLGKDDSTPLGTWMVKPESKLKNPTYYNPREEGDRIVQADDPQNPLGEYWLGLVGIDGHAVGKESYGIHGTIEPDSIGKMASLGCIRLVNENVAQVFDMFVETKSTVVVKD
jgi:lipoprotein-anchoring transpeptidase ErfK/SrfK